MSKKLTIYDEQSALNYSLGSLGFKVISNQTLTAPDNHVFIALLNDTDAEYSAISTTGDNLSLQTRTAGNIRLGRFSSVTVADTGIVLGYLAKSTEYD